LLIGKSPLRLGFAGGGTDLAEYHEKFDGYTISYTIDKSTFVLARTRNDNKFQGFSPDFESHHPPKGFKKLELIQGHEIIVTLLKEMKFNKGIDMFFCSDVRPGSGLGASSSLATNLVNVLLILQNKKWAKNKIASKAYKIAHDVLKWNLGKQDEFSSIFGGLNLIHYKKNKVTVEPIKLNKPTISKLQKSSLLFSIDKQRATSDSILSKQVEQTKTNKQTISALHDAANLALELRDQLRSNNISEFGNILNRSWELKKKYTSSVTNKKIDLIIHTALKHGADGIKITGAGGGGHLYCYAHSKKHSNIINNLKKLGVKRVDFKYQSEGATIFNTNCF
jgi:D-glycero-alpha-D-manno-heptose-7-phosphate kinase